MPSNHGVRPSADAPTNLLVKMRALVWLHRDVAGERVQQADVFVGRVRKFPVEMLNQDDPEEAVRFNSVQLLY